MKLMSRYFTPSQMGKVYVGIGVVFVFGITVLIMEALEPESRQRVKPPKIENIITERNSRQFGLDAVNDKVVGQSRLIGEQNKQLEEVIAENEKLKKEVQEAKRLNSNSGSMERQLEKMQKQVDEMAKKQQTFQERVANENQYSNQTRLPSDTNDSTEVKHPELKVNPERRKVSGSSFSYGNKQENGSDTQYQSTGNNHTGNNSGSSTDNRTGELFAIIEDEEEIERTTQQDSQEIYLPKSSILTGVLITGLDAPTASTAADNPIPVLVRIKKEAILPNFATVQEVNECFALMAGYGDLSSERAMLRGESITCVRHDKTVIEADFSSFAVGEDGKNGLKGTLVTRNSTVLANAMMAGFSAGLASMFDVNPVPVIATGSSGTQQYQDVFSPDAISGGAAKGASEAMTKLADYYMELADSMHPIIEIGAGRVVDMVITQGTTL